MAQRLDFVTMEVAGQVMDRWVDYQMDSDLFIPSDAFRLSVDVPVNDEDEVRDRVTKGAPIKVYVTRVQRDGGRRRSLQMTGYIDTRNLSISRGGGLQLSVSGRDRAQILCDANVPPGLICDNHSDRFITLLQNGVDPYDFEVISDDSAERSILTGERRTQPLTTLERREARALGVPPSRYTRERLARARQSGVPLDESLGVSADTGARFASGQTPSDIDRLTIREARPNSGETIWDYFTRHAQRLGLMLWFTADGKLVVGAPDWSQEPTYRIIRRVVDNPEDPNNVLSGQLSESILNSYSKVVVKGRASTQDGLRERISVTVENPDWPDNAPEKPRYIKDPTIRDEESARRRGLRELASGRAKQFQLTYEMDGHGQGDRLWAQGTVAYVHDERLGVRGRFFISGRQFKYSNGPGTTTQVRLIKLESFEI